MQTGLATLDRLLARRSPWQILAISSCGVVVIGTVDYLTGYEVSISILYLVPVAAASWYAGRRASVSIAVLGCMSWFAADVGAGHPYEHLAVPIWNALVRFGFFLVNGLLMVSLRESLFRQRELARRDALTDVFGRRAFEERLEHDLDLARRNGNPLTVAFVDLDDFKTLNDTRGHVVGDLALRVTARVLQDATRRTDTVARLGGDEFALVLPDTARQGAEEVIEKLRCDLREALGPVAAGLTCSIGVITFEDGAPQLEEVIRAADALMYQAKRDGKDAVAFKVAAARTREGVRSPVAVDASRTSGR